MNVLESITSQKSFEQILQDQNRTGSCERDRQQNRAQQIIALPPERQNILGVPDLCLGLGRFYEQLELFDRQRHQANVKPI